MGLNRQPKQKFGGLDTSVAPYDIETAKSPDALNVRLLNPKDDETIVQRRGKSLVSTQGIAAPPTTRLVEGVYAVANGSGSVFWADTGGSLYSSGLPLQGNSNIWANLFAGASDRWSIAGAFDKVWFMPLLGFSVPKKYISGAAVAAWGGAPPQQGQDLAFWRGRMVSCYGQHSAAGINRSRVNYSDTGDPELPAAGWNFIDIYDDYFSPNVGLLVHNNNLYLFKGHSVWMIYDPNTFASRLITRNGCWAAKAKVSNPFDRRIYWFCAQDGHIHSSNGETDDVIETWRVGPTLKTVDLQGQQYGRMIVDPSNGSVLFTWATSYAAGNLLNNRMLEITQAGPTGDHEIFLHDMTSQAILTAPVTVPAAGYTEILVVSDGGAVGRVYNPFSAVGNDDGVAISAKYVSSWLSFISEEPMERIRRMNFLYRGDPVIDLSSVVAPVAAPAVTTYTPTAFPGASDTDRTYLSLRGPNTRGRYHRFTVRNSTLNKEFMLSALEFIYRGGKVKK